MITNSQEGNIKTVTVDASNFQKNQDLNTGKWTNEENLKYAIFMDFYKTTLSSRSKKKYNLHNLRDFKVFEEMAKFIVSRNTVQCRSHHQKLEQRFKNFKKIISAVKNQIGRKQYKAEFKKWTNDGEGLVIQEPKIRENPEMSQVSTKKEHRKEEVQGQQAKTINLEGIPTAGVYPLFAYPTYYNHFNYCFPNVYSFPTHLF